jgi:hypothetical protein
VGFLGSDTDALRSLSETFDDRADALEDVAQKAFERIASHQRTGGATIVRLSSRRRRR